MQLSQYRTEDVSPLEQQSILNSFSCKVGGNINYHGVVEDFSSAIDTLKLSEDISNNILHNVWMVGAHYKKHSRYSRIRNTMENDAVYLFIHYKFDTII